MHFISSTYPWSAFIHFPTIAYRNITPVVKYLNRDMMCFRMNKKLSEPVIYVIMHDNG